VVERAARAQRPAAPRPPTATQLRSARAQRAEHVSQGRQVQKAAEIAQRVAAAQPYLSSAEAVSNRAAALDAADAIKRKNPDAELKVLGTQIYAKYKRPILKDYWSPIKPTGKPDEGQAVHESEIRKATAAAPALKILDQTTRPIHAVAAGSKAAIQGKGASGIARAEARGLQLKDRTLFSDVLKTAGVKNKGMAAAGGFALDVALDPTTYLTGGTARVAEKVAADAARQTAVKAARAGMSEEGVATVAARAARQAAEQAPAGKGVTVKFAGHEVPGVRRGTAAVARGIRAPVRKVAPVASRTVPAKLRHVAREFAPTVRQSGVSETAHVGARQATRQARATVGTAEARALQLAQDLRRKLSEEDYAKVADAIDRNDFRKLTPELAQQAHRLRSALKGSRRVSRRAGVAAGHTAGDASRFLSKTDLGRLDKSVAAEQRAQKRAISRSVTKEQASRERALVTEAVGSQTGRRAQQAATRYERKAADTHLSTQKLKAAQAVPKLKTGESHAAYLQRVINHATAHDLPLVKARAEKLTAKVPQDVAQGYFPREFEPRVLKKLGLTAEEAATRTVRAGAAPSRTVGRTTAGFARNDQRALRTVNPERVAAGQEPFSTNVPLVTLNHLKTAARATSEGEFAKHMAELGRKITSPEDLRPGESIYKLGYQGRKFGLHEVRGLPKRPTRGGQYVALDRGMLEDMKGAVQQVRSGNPVGQVLDKVTGRWKRLATATPGFHVRNLIGDTAQAYLAAPGHQLPRNIAQAGKAVRRASEQARTLTPPASHATIKVRGERQTVDEFLKGARENGVLDAGYIGKELHDLVEPATAKAGKVKRGKGTVNRWMTNRENLMRLATYKAGLDRGMKPPEAADLANHFHIDYGDLSDTERRYMRRVFPFYTWTSRSLPVMAKALVTQPGKFATIEKAREETESGFGLNEQAVRRGMSEAISRQVPAVIKIGDKALGISASLPVTLLNELPTGVGKDDLSAYLSELGRFGFQMLSPIAKIPIEQQSGVSLYTKRPIEDPQRPLTAAPSWVRWLPATAKRELDVTPSFVDKRTGKKTWGWRGQADYWSRQIPGAPQQVATVASGGRPGQPKDVGTALIGAAGVRVDSLNAQAVKRTKEVQVYKQLAKLNRRAAELNQQGVNSDNPTAEYKSLRKQINALTKQVRPRKAKGGGGSLFDQPASSSGSLFDSSSSGGGGSGSLFDK
jgi:hypothetical protein